MRVSRPGWSLLELLVVVSITGILLSFLLVALLQVEERANQAVCLNNLRQLALACQAYHSEREKLPPFSCSPPEWPVFGGWWIELMPYADQENLYKKILQDEQPRKINGGTVFPQAFLLEGTHNAYFELLRCRSDPSFGHGFWGTTNYLANWYAFAGSHGCYAPPQGFQMFTDGLSNTVLFAEGYADCNGVPRPALVACTYHNFGVTPLGKPSDDPSLLPNDYTMFQVRPIPPKCDYMRSQTPHENMPVALADGSAHFIQAGIQPALWKQLLKPADGGPMGEEW